MAAVALIAAGPAVPTLAADTGAWTLEAATRHVLEQAPEPRAADAAVAGRVAELRAAGSWPNPNIELRADDKLGLDDGRGGTNLTRAGISQPLPFRRLARQHAAAEAALQSSEANRRAQQLQLEQETALVFATLQLAAARYKLAQERLAAAAGYPDHGGGRARRDPLVRYLTPLEQRRLAVLREEAQQAVLATQREYENAQTAFRALLALVPDEPLQVAPLATPVTPPALAELERGLEVHPTVVSAQQDVEAARAGIAVAESQRFNDPELGLFRERDFLNGARRDVTAIELSIQIPLWNLNRGPVDRARAAAIRAQTNLSIAKRDLTSRLRQSHTDLTGLLAQTGRMRASLLEPAREVLDLTRRGFSSGEANILALVDANNTYFDAQARYLEALKDAALATASLRLAAGRSVLGAEVLP